ncbi:MAG: hypothetical protein R6V03_00630 [Kiritimatiellia bacterium]
MPISSLTKRLEGIGRMILAWRAEIVFAIGAAAFMVMLWTFSLTDFLVQLTRIARFATWLVLVALVVEMVRRMSKTAARRFTPESVAATVESNFPELDNRLINFLLFSRQKQKDPFTQAYLKEGIPGWNSVKPGLMKNRKLHYRAWLGVLAAVLLLAVPGFFLGKAWGVAIWRVINPFSSVPPVSQTRIVAVTPGNTNLVQGAQLIVSAEIVGKKGHKVWLDVNPADGEETTYSLGSVEGEESEKPFRHRIYSVNSDMKYRFRAGDAPSPSWYKVSTRPPPALTELEVEVTPPPYTSLASRRFDGQEQDVQVPYGSRAEVTVEWNTSLRSVMLSCDGKRINMAPSAGGRRWSADLKLTGGNCLRIQGEDNYGETIDTNVGFVLIADRGPTIEILSPKGRPTLPPGASPSIEFAVSDDYGLTRTAVEKVVAGSARKIEGKEIQSWDLGGVRDTTKLWAGAEENSDRSDVLAYRIVAVDNVPGEPHVTRSDVILFNAESYEEAAEKREDLETEAVSLLAKLIDMQKDTLNRTRSYLGIIDNTNAEHWRKVAGLQKDIRVFTKKLLENPITPLGNLTPTVKKLYVNEMTQLITVLSNVPRVPKKQKAGEVESAIAMQKKILRQLTYSEVAASQTKVERRSSALQSMLSALVKGQEKVLHVTEEYVAKSARIGGMVVDDQDALAIDLVDFMKACRRESAAVENNDKQYSKLLLEVASACENKGVRNDMMMAAEKLDMGQAVEAVPHERQALLKLKEIQKFFKDVELAAEELKQEQILGAVEEAKARLSKVMKLHKEAIDFMDQIKAQKDKDSRKIDLMEEEFQELVKNTEEALMEVPKGLHMFNDLAVANDQVEDVFSMFEEVKKKEENELGEGADGEVQEIAVAKREELLDAMEKAKGRLDDVEMWLGRSPDNHKVETESFDKEEMPEAGVAPGALAAEAEDLIGDLMKESDPGAADDGAHNQAQADMPMGWEVMEGDLISFAAKGKSGNEAPDHKEQDGRGNIGREGMAVGETAAGSGTIGKGDENIEERRTQDPTQSGQVDAEAEEGAGEAKATGGGKQGSGKADEFGGFGGNRRMDGTTPTSPEAMLDLLAGRADALYAKASMKNIRVDELKKAANHLRQAGDCIAKGDIRRVREHRKEAVGALQKGRVLLTAETETAIPEEAEADVLEDVIESGPEDAPLKYRDLVSEYYKALM